MIEYFHRYMPLTGKASITYSKEVAEEKREEFRKEMDFQGIGKAYKYEFKMKEDIQVDISYGDGYYTTLIHKEIEGRDIPLMYTIACTNESKREMLYEFIGGMYNGIKKLIPKGFIDKPLEIPQVPFIVDVLMPIFYVSLIDDWALDFSLLLAWSLLGDEDCKLALSPYSSVNLNYDSPILRESVECFPGARRDDYKGLPEELKEYNYYIPDCGHSIMAIPDSLLETAQSDGDLYDYEVPFPVKYVLKKGYKIVSGHVVCPGKYNSATGLHIEDGYEEF